MMRAVLIAALLGAAACGSSSPGGMNGPTINNHMSSTPADAAPAPTTAAVSPVVSSDILAREPVANTSTVKHILISWKDLSDSYNGHLDPRAAKRTKADAEAEVKSILAQLAAGADFDALMKAKSEDTGSAQSGIPFTVTPDAQLVIEFRQMGLRLHVGEIGVVESDFGFHIIRRYE